MKKTATHPRACKNGDVNYCETASPPNSPSQQPSEGSQQSGSPSEGCRSDHTPQLPVWVPHFEQRMLQQFHHHQEQLKEQFQIHLKELESKILSSIDIKLKELEMQLKKEQSDMKQEYEEKISHMETNFNHSLELQKNMINGLTASATNLEKELRSMKQNEAEKLSRNLILSGSAIPIASPSENLTKEAAALIKEHTRYNVTESHIASAERLGRKPAQGKEDKRVILVKLHNKELKFDIIKHNLQQRSEGFYISEQLTPEVNDLYREIRKLRKGNRSLIAVLHTYKGIIRAKKSHDGQCYDILTSADLEKFKKDVGIRVE